VKEASNALKRNGLTGKVRLMPEDEAGFGRINKPRSCWCPKGVRPVVPCHHIRQHRYAFGAVDPIDGEKFFLTAPKCNTEMMNIYLSELSKYFPSDFIVLMCDRAGWHGSKTLAIPDNICIVNIPPYTPEMNPMEQIWREIRTQGFRNEIFQTLEKVDDRLCDTICDLSPDTIKSICGRQWLLECF